MKVIFPSKPLASYVEAYYPASDERQSGPEIPFSAGTSGYIKFSVVSTIVSGQTTGPTISKTECGSSGFGIKLRIGALYGLFGVPAHELTNQVVSLADLPGCAAEEFSAVLTEGETFPSQVKIFERVLANHIRRNCDSRKMIEQKILATLQRGSQIAVAQLADELGYSARQLQRKFNDLIGLSPRMFRRISRFERAYRATQLLRATTGNINWPRLARDYGYSDQAHLIREFHEFTGYSPAHYPTPSLASMSDSFKTRST